MMTLASEHAKPLLQILQFAAAQHPPADDLRVCPPALRWFLHAIVRNSPAPGCECVYVCLPACVCVR